MTACVAPRPLLAVDAATTSGVALWRPGPVDGGVCLYTLAAVCALAATVPRISRAIYQLSSAPPALVLVEEPYLGTATGAGQVQVSLVHSFERLVTMRTRWATVAELAGHEVALVTASAWQTQVLKDWGGGAKTKRKARKDASLRLCRAALGLDDVTEDEADAVCLGLYGLGLETKRSGVVCRPDQDTARDAVRRI